MALRGWIKRMERAARGNLASFELLDGSRYYFDPLTWEPFMHMCDCLKAGSAHNWPPAPEVVQKLAEAKDVEGAIELVRAGGSDFLPYDIEVLINERRLQPRGLVTRYDPDLGEHVVLDPYDYEVPDLSEP